MDKYRWYIWGGIGAVALIAVLALAIDSALHTLRSTGEAVARTPAQVAFIDITDFDGEQESGDVYLLDADSGEVTRLTTGGQVTRMVWTPDGERLYLATRTGREGTYTNQLEVATGALTEFKDIEDSDLARLYGAVSPDGEMIAYGTATTQYGATRTIIIAHIDGTEAHEIADGGEPDWSPDGKRIVYARSGDIYSMAASGGDTQTIAALADKEVLPAWSGDGKTIAFASLTIDAMGGAGGGYLYRADPDGGNLTRLAEVYYPSRVRFMADNQTIYVSDAGQTCFVPIDGSKPICKQLAATDVSPDGKRIIKAEGDPVVYPDRAPAVVHVCEGLISGRILADGQCYFDSEAGVTDMAWRPGR